MLGRTLPSGGASRGAPPLMGAGQGKTVQFSPLTRKQWSIWPGEKRNYSSFQAFLMKNMPLADPSAKREKLLEQYLKLYLPEIEAFMKLVPKDRLPNICYALITTEHSAIRPSQPIPGGDGRPGSATTPTLKRAQFYTDEQREEVSGAMLDLTTFLMKRFGATFMCLNTALYEGKVNPKTRFPDKVTDIGGKTGFEVNNLSAIAVSVLGGETLVGWVKKLHEAVSQGVSADGLSDDWAYPSHGPHSKDLKENVITIPAAKHELSDGKDLKILVAICKDLLRLGHPEALDKLLKERILVLCPSLNVGYDLARDPKTGSLQIVIAGLNPTSHKPEIRMGYLDSEILAQDHAELEDQQNASKMALWDQVVRSLFTQQGLVGKLLDHMKTPIGAEPKSKGEVAKPHSGDQGNVVILPEFVINDPSAEGSNHPGEKEGKVSEGGDGSMDKLSKL